MKIKNKLLPLLGTVALSGAIAPIAMMTSCVDHGIQMVEVANGYEYNQPIYESNEYLTQNSATKAFIDAVAKNPEIFKAELYSSYYRYCQQMARQLGLRTLLKSAKVGISDPKIKMIAVDFPGEAPVTYPVISFKLKFDVEFVQSMPYEDYGYTSTSIAYKGENEYKDVPFYAYQSLQDTTDGKKMKALMSSSENDSNWTIGMLDVMYNNDYIMKFMRGWEIKTSFNTTKTKIEYTPDTGRQVSTEKQNFSKKYTTHDEITKLINDNETSNIAKNIVSFDFASTFLSRTKSTPTVFTKGLTFSITDFDEEEDGAPKVSEIIGAYVSLTPELASMIGTYRDYWGFNTLQDTIDALNKQFYLKFKTEGDESQKFEVEGSGGEKYLAEIENIKVDFLNEKQIGSLVPALPVVFELRFITDSEHTEKPKQHDEKSQNLSIKFKNSYELEIKWASNWYERLYQEVEPEWKDFAPINFYPNKNSVDFDIPAKYEGGPVTFKQYFKDPSNRSGLKYIPPRDSSSEEVLPKDYRIELFIPFADGIDADKFDYEYQNLDVVDDGDIKVTCYNGEGESVTGLKKNNAAASLDYSNEGLILSFEVTVPAHQSFWTNGFKYDIEKIGNLSFRYWDEETNQYRLLKTEIPTFTEVELHWFSEAL